jgi:hypothetical protein
LSQYSFDLNLFIFSPLLFFPLVTILPPFKNVPCPQGTTVDISGEDPQQIPKWPQMVTGFSSESRPALPLDCDV